MARINDTNAKRLYLWGETDERRRKRTSLLDKERRIEEDFGHMEASLRKTILGRIYLRRGALRLIGHTVGEGCTLI